VGQYYVIVNLDKREYLDPHAFGNGMKLLEFGVDGTSVMTGLAILLASSNGQGGGDLHVPEGSEWEDVPGRWAGDRIVVAGDYDDREGSPGYGIYRRCRESSPMEELANAMEPTGMFTDISGLVMGCLLEDSWFRSTFLTLPEGNKTWEDYNKKVKRDIWVRARPNEEVPELLR